MANTLKRPFNLRYILLMFTLGLLISSLAYIKPLLVYGQCMLPIIKPYDIVLVYPLSSFKKGDIVAVDAPGRGIYVKRIVGIPGDFIEVKKDSIAINGVRYPIEIEKAIEYGIEIPEFPNNIPPHHVFLAGDNGSKSFDSRYIGLIHFKDVKGKVIGVIPTGSIF